jgi:hypothetical protein
MRRLHLVLALWVPFTVLPAGAHGDSAARVDVRIRLEYPRQSAHSTPPAVVWLKPVQSDFPDPPIVRERYILMQKGRTFHPHVLVVPVGSVVQFPNADPFFHNVFSLFDGKRFDLGLYEAGSTKEVAFSREGVSYIFCNIHPEMSAVVLALSTPYHAMVDATGNFELHDIPAGDYELHAWVEGLTQPTLDRLTRHVHVNSKTTDLGSLDLAETPRWPGPHLNKFGQPYDQDTKPTY